MDDNQLEIHVHQVRSDTRAGRRAQCIPRLDLETLTFDVALVAQRLPEGCFSSFRIVSDDEPDASHAIGLRLLRGGNHRKRATKTGETG
jgi:hypothetical protein